MKLPDAAVAIVGAILQVEATRNFETKKADGGCKVLIASSGGDGLANVKLRPDEANALTPVVGEQVAWMIRYGAYSAGSGAETYAGFVRRVTPSDVGALDAAMGSKK